MPYTIREWAVDCQPLGYVRLVFRLLNLFSKRGYERLLILLGLLSPAFFPSFALCWMQLVRQTNIVRRFLGSTEPRTTQFYVNFVLICIRLAKIPAQFREGKQ
jgi:hypothetical protein